MEPVDVVIRPEDIDIVPAEKGLVSLIARASSWSWVT